MGELIWKSDAIDAIKEFKHGATEWRDEQEECSDIWHRADSAIASALEIGLRVKKIPSAQLWIPCSKGLPEIDEETGESILCNVTLKNGNVTADFRSVYNGDNWYNYGSSVVAWMELPEPYKEEKE